MDNKGSFCKSSTKTIQSKVVEQIREGCAVDADSRPIRGGTGGHQLLFWDSFLGSREGEVWLLMRVARGVVLINRFDHIIIFLYVCFQNTSNFSHM